MSTRRLLPLVPLALFLTACPDPTGASKPTAMEVAKPDAVPAEGAAPTGSPNGGAGGGPGTPGLPNGSAPTGGRPVPKGFQVEAGKGVKLSGNIIYSGSKTGTLRIDFLKQSAETGFPELLHSMTLAQPGPWEVEVPQNAGAMGIVAFIDSTDNGPDPDEPSGTVEKEVTIGTQAMPGLDITLSDTVKPKPGETKPGDLGPQGVGGASPVGSPNPNAASYGPPPQPSAAGPAPGDVVINPGKEKPTK